MYRCLKFSPDTTMHTYSDTHCHCRIIKSIHVIADSKLHNKVMSRHLLLTKTTQRHTYRNQLTVNTVNSSVFGSVFFSFPKVIFLVNTLLMTSGPEKIMTSILASSINKPSNITTTVLNTFCEDMVLLTSFLSLFFYHFV